MSLTRLLPLSFICALALFAPAFAQIAQPDNNVEQVAGRLTSTVTASATAERVRFAAPNTVVQLRLEVYDETGQKLLDTEQRGGNVLDWHLQGGAGERVADGVYLCVLTIKNLSGRLGQKLGRVTVSGQSTEVRSAAVAELAPRQAQAVGPVESGEAGLTVLGAEDTPPVTVLANSGDEAQLARTRGALTFRVGDFFSGSDKEQMRLTEDGNLGIGTTKPKVKLDVAGMIRAREGFMFSDGSMLKLNEKGVLTRTNADGTALSPAATTQDKIAKFTDNAGTVGDSVITELAGNIGIGTPTPTQALEVANGRIVTSGSKTLTGQEGILEIGTTVTNNNTVASGIRLRNTYNGNASVQQALDVAPTFAPSASITRARGFVSAAFFAPPAGVTITDAFGGNAVNVYNATSGAVTNGTAFALNSPIVFGSLKPTAQYGLRINNQGIGGTANSYGLFVDGQSGSINSYSAIFAGGNVGIGTATPGALLDVAGDINTSTQFNIGGFRILGAQVGGNTFVGLNAGLSNTGSSNSFFGNGAGDFNTTGSNNSFFGGNAGLDNSSGSFNAFLGTNAGVLNTTGSNNSFFGRLAGQSNTTASQNSFFGEEAGAANTVQGNNSFFGYHAGKAATVGGNSFFGTSAGETNSTGATNSFFGINAGFANSSGSLNAFFGAGAGVNNSSGGSNAFFGRNAGNNNFTGSSNTIVGDSADVNGPNLTNATAIGANAFVAQSNSLVLGSINGTNGATADTRVGIGTITPAKHLHIRGAGDQEVAIESSDSSGRQWTLQSARGAADGRFEIIDRTANLNRFTILSDGTVGIGTTTPNAKMEITDNGGRILFGGAGCSSGFAGITFNTTQPTCTNYALIGDGQHTIINAPDTVNTLGHISFRLNNTEVMEIATDAVHLSGLDNLAVGTNHLCLNQFDEISLCGSSARFKTDIKGFDSGLTLIKGLRPVSFAWKTSGTLDVGLIAEDVAAVEPLLVTHNKQGQIQGVKYDRVGVVLINAVKEQQTQIEQQQGQLKTQQLLIQQQQTRLAQQQGQLTQQQQQLAALKGLVCRSHPKAALCK